MTLPSCLFQILEEIHVPWLGAASSIPKAEAEHLHVSWLKLTSRLPLRRPLVFQAHPDNPRESPIPGPELNKVPSTMSGHTATAS